MEQFRLILAILGIFAVVYFLIKKKDTKTVLIGVGIILCTLCFKPMAALAAFTAYMTKAGLIKAICASMGFAFVMKATGCDKHLVTILTKPLKNIGFLLIPMTTILTFFINIAIPSASGCSAAVGATLIPLLMASGIHPAMAAASVLAGTFGGTLSPGSAHNIFIANLVKETNPAYSVPDVIQIQFINSMTSLCIVVAVMFIMAFVFRDYSKGTNYLAENSTTQQQEDIKPNYLFALVPLFPLAVLIVGGSELSDSVEYLKWTKMGVAEAMILGVIVSLFVTLTNPQKITKEFFSGMGSAYAEIIGIIIAAGVFVAGLKACGAIDVIIEILKQEQHYVKFGGTFIPFIMGLVTGSGDAATFAFNQAVTVHADALGFAQDKLGMAATICGSLGRSASPISGACIVCAGLAMVSPIQIVKRTALAMLCSVFVIAFIIL